MKQKKSKENIKIEATQPTSEHMRKTEQASKEKKDYPTQPNEALADPGNTKIELNCTQIAPTIFKTKVEDTRKVEELKQKFQKKEQERKKELEELEESEKLLD